MKILPSLEGNTSLLLVKLKSCDQCNVLCNVQSSYFHKVAGKNSPLVVTDYSLKMGWNSSKFKR